MEADKNIDKIRRYLPNKYWKCCKIDEKIWMFKNIEKIIYGFIVKSYYISSFSIMEDTSNILG